MIQTYVILLRGVMPIGKNKVPMAELRKALTSAGLLNVQTYIQTGNVVAQSEHPQSTIEQMVHQAIMNQIGAEIIVIARDATTFNTIFSNNPIHTVDSSKVYFSIPQQPFDTQLLDAFIKQDFSPDAVQVVDNVLYTQYATKYSDSKWNNNFFEKQLNVSITTRNYNTMKKLVELSST